MTRNHYSPPGARVGDAGGSALFAAARYAAIFGLSHFLLAYTIGWIYQTVFPEADHPHGGVWLGFLVTFAAAWIVGLVFVRRAHRDFNRQELTYLFIGCLVYLCLFDALSYLSNPQYQTPPTIASWAILVGVTLGLEILSLWLAYRWMVRDAVKKYLDAHVGSQPNKSLERTREG
jgi:uncharacterized membrane protein (DUF485 family)